MTTTPFLRIPLIRMALGLVLIGIVSLAVTACLAAATGCAPTARTTITPASTSLGATETRTTILAEPASAPSERVVRIRVISPEPAHATPPAAADPGPGPAGPTGPR